MPCIGKKFRSFREIPCIGKNGFFFVLARAWIRNPNEKASHYKVTLVLINYLFYVALDSNAIYFLFLFGYDACIV